MSKIKKIKT